MGKAEDTKARIERASLALFVARGVAETTTKEIAMAASIAEGTIYRYFPSKEQLALDMFLGHHRALAEALSEAQRTPKGPARQDRGDRRAATATGRTATGRCSPITC